jgi:hypothetical protein
LLRQDSALMPKGPRGEKHPGRRRRIVVGMNSTSWGILAIAIVSWALIPLMIFIHRWATAAGLVVFGTAVAVAAFSQGKTDA